MDDNNRDYPDADIEGTQEEAIGEDVEETEADTGRRVPVKKERPIRPGRLYVTGIVTGILLVTAVMLFCDVFDFHPFSRTPAADRIYNLTGTLESYIRDYF